MCTIILQGYPHHTTIKRKNKTAKGAAFWHKNKESMTAADVIRNTKRCKLGDIIQNIPHGLQSESHNRTPVTVDMEGSELFEQKFLRSDTIPLTGRDSPMMGP